MAASFDGKEQTPSPVSIRRYELGWASVYRWTQAQGRSMYPTVSVLGRPRQRIVLSLRLALVT